MNDPGMAPPEESKDHPDSTESSSMHPTSGDGSEMDYSRVPLPPAPPFSPTSGGGNTVFPAGMQGYASQNVVSELQRVYEAMTGREDGEQQHQYSYDTTSLPQHGDVYNSLTNLSHMTSQHLSGSTEDENNEEESMSLRRTRKRAAAPSDLREEAGAGGSQADNGSVDSSSRGRKKKEGKWSKRFIWPEDLHRDFVSAIFDVGLKHASPNVVLENMPPHPEVSAERIKSHLQKYRMHRVKSKKQFMSQYETTLQQLQHNQGSHGEKKSLSAGEVAGHVAYASMTEGDTPSSDKDTDSPSAQSPSLKKPPQNEGLLLPVLTEAERNSPIGASMGYLMGLFFTLRQQLMTQRAMAAKLEASQVAEISNQVAAASSSRTNLVESNKMKREMQSQMAFQNKMRQLKQQEVNKYSHATSAGGVPADQQSSGEAPDHARTRGLSLGLDGGDFNWALDGEDEQLFEFLLNE